MTASAARTRIFRVRRHGVRFQGQPLYDRLWGAGFLPSRYQGVRFRSGADPVLYLDPKGFHRDDRRRFLDDLGKLNEMHRQSMPTQSPPASRNTRWPSGCRPRCRS
ncbi:MAG: DUF1501 domain-containing protein [Bryobacterales bacterium]